MKNKGNKNKESLILTRETIGMTLMLFCAIVLLALFTGKAVFSGFGAAICTFMYGTFGYGSYFVLASLAYLGEWLAFEKKIKVKIRPAIWCALTLLNIFLLFHAVSTRNFAFDGSYISACFSSAKEGWSGYTFGGVISALIVYPVAKLTKLVGAYVIFSILIVLFGYFSVMSVRKHYFKRDGTEKALADEGGIKTDVNSAQANPNGQPYQAQGFSDNGYGMPLSGADGQAAQPLYTQPEYNGQPVYNNADQSFAQQFAYDGLSPAQQVFGGQKPQPAQSEEIDYKTLGHKLLFENGEFDAENYRRNGIFDENSYFNHPISNKDDYIKSFSDEKKTSGTNIQQTYSSAYKQSVEQQDVSMPNSVYYGDEPADKLEDYTQASTGAYKDEPGDYTDSAEDKNPYEVFPYQTDESKETEEQQSDYNFDRPLEQDSSSVGNTSDNIGMDFENNTDIFSSRGRDVSRDASADNIQPNILNDRNRESADRFSSGEEKPGEDSGGIGSLYNLFGSGNSRLKESKSQQDDGMSSYRRANRSEADPFEGQNRISRERDDAGFVGPNELDGGNRETESRSERGGSNLFAGDTESRRGSSNSNLFDDEPVFDNGDNDGLADIGRGGLGGRSLINEETPRSRMMNSSPSSMTRAAAAKEESNDKPAPPPHVWKKYVRPGLDLLDDYPEYANVNTAEVEDSKRIIVETLNSFRIDCEISDVVIGPAITRYDIIIHDRTNIKNSLRYRESIAMALKKDNVNAYLNYGKGALSIEVPNTKRSTIGLKTMLTSSSFMNCKSTSLTFALGKNVDGVPVCPDITKMPHLLVAGTTGSGKSICLSSLLISLLYKYGPEDLRFILVDPKQVEFISYDKLPHLMINEIIYDVDKAIKALNWAIKEMERRYSLFKAMTETGANAKGGAKVATKNLDEYNSHREEGVEKLPKIVIVLDEFGDLMLQAKKDIEGRIIKLVQKARASGIHLILATQRPSVDCITGLIKSNLPTRIGFKVGSFDDSRTIFDVGGAEKLLGAGDMYFRSAERPELTRIQGCFVDSHEVQKVTDFVKANNETYFDQSVSDFINTVEESDTSSSSADGGNYDAEETKIDEVYLHALKYCIESNKASVSMLQRRFPIGYMKACKIIDWMENMNYISKGEGPNSRKVLLSRDEFIDTYGDIDD